MNDQNKFLLPDKSIWRALTREQREVLSSKYTILCPIILLAEIAKDGVNMINALLSLDNIIAISHWSEHAKIDLLTEASSKPLFFGTPSGGKPIRECSEQELSALIELSDGIIETLIESENSLKKYLDSAIDPWKEELLGMVNNIENLPDEELLDWLKEFMRGYQAYSPEIAHIFKRIDTHGFPQRMRKRLIAVVERIYGRFKADTLNNTYQLVTTLLNRDPINRSNALDKLQWLCGLFSPTQEEHTQIINRFLKERMPPIRSFAPYALGVAAWLLTIHLYLRENPENAAPVGVYRDAQYLLYTFYKNVTFVSADTWHKKFINEVPLFANIRENFIFIPHKNKNEKEFKKGLRSLGLKVKEN